MSLPLVISAKRTGSTILQNVTHILLTGEKGLVPKSHGFKKTNGKVIIPIRDPRDTAISFYRTIVSNQKKIDRIEDINVFKNSEILRNLNLMVDLYNFYKDNPNALIVRYEDVYTNRLGEYSNLMTKLSKFFELELTDELVDKVNHYLNIDDMKSVSDSLATFQKHDSNLDSSFCIHGNHIEDTNVIGWRERVDSNIVNELNNLYNDYILKLNYTL
jgi:hypothetical protein